MTIDDIEENYSAELKCIFEDAASIPGISSIIYISIKNSCTITSAHSLLPFSKPVKTSNKGERDCSCKSCLMKIDVNKVPEENIKANK